MLNNFVPRIGLPPVVKNLLILNVLFFAGMYVAESTWHFDLTHLFGLHYFKSQYFKPYQYITYMFMHGNLMHIFFNMYALWMFGKVLEEYWGPKKFLIYYFVTGIGAAILNTAVSWWSISKLVDLQTIYMNTPSPDTFAAIVRDHFPQYNDGIVEFLKAWMNDVGNQGYIAETKKFFDFRITELINVPTVGASGAVFGVLLAFGMSFPNTQLMLLFPPIPIKAKYIVMIYGAIEVYFAILQQPGDNVAHFAHLGGMLFGFILIKYWGRKRNNTWNP